MRVVRGREQEQMGGEEFAALLSGYARLVVDVGTGDGLGAYRVAAASPDTLCVGLDPVAENMAATAARSRRKPARGGLPNLLLVVAAVEDPPEELRGKSDEVRCVLPWGRLLEGLALPDPEVLAGVRALARPGAPVRIVLNTGVWGGSAPRDVDDLPEVTADRVTSELAPAYEAAGLLVTEHRDESPGAVRRLGTTWAGRLTHGGGGRFLRIDAVAR